MADYGDFLQAFQVGANVQNMAWQRQERMQQLRAQEALLRIKERMETYEVQELVARRDKYFEDAMTTQADRIRKAAALKAAADMFPAKIQASGGDPMKALGDMVSPVSAMDPEVGAELGLAYQRGMAGQMKDKMTPYQEQTLDLAKRREDRQVKVQERLEEREKRLAERYALTESEKQQVYSIYDQIRILNKQRLELDPDQVGNKSKRYKLAVEAGRLQKQVDAITKGKEKAAEPAAATTGRVKVKSPDGRVGTIPESELEEALAEGYERVEE